MSRIPTSAMPRANAPKEPDGQEGGEGGGTSVKKKAGQIAEKARENPKTAIAAGAVVVGAIAAAAIPLVRGARGKRSEGKDSGDGGSKKKKKG